MGKMNEMKEFQRHLYSFISLKGNLNKYSKTVCVLVAQSYPTFVTPSTVACHVSLSVDFSRQGYWSE